MTSGFITVKKASELLKVTPHYIRKLIKENKISGQQIKNSNRWEVERASIEKYRKTDIFENDLSDLQKPQQITIKEAVENVEDIFDGDVISYIMTLDRGAIIESGDIIQLNDLLFSMQARTKGKKGKKFKKIILILNSGGGIMEAAIKLVAVIKTYAEEFEVIVPFISKSAATLISLKADKLYLTPISELGPIDPIVQSPTNPSIMVPAQAIKRFLENYGSGPSKTNNENNEVKNIILGKLNDAIDPYLLSAYQAATDFAKEELDEILKEYKLDNDQQKSAHELFLQKKSHSYPILYQHLKDIGMEKKSEMMQDPEHLKHIQILSNLYGSFMGGNGVIKLIGNRNTNMNTFSAAQLKQKLVQTGN